MNRSDQELRQVRDFASDMQLSIALMRKLWSPLSKGIISLLSPLVIMTLILISSNLKKLFAPLENPNGMSVANSFDETLITMGWIGLIIFIAYGVLQAAMIAMAIGGVDFWSKNKIAPNLKDLFFYVKKYTLKIVGVTILFSLLVGISYVIVMLPLSLAASSILGALFSILFSFAFVGLGIYAFTVYGLVCSHLILGKDSVGDSIANCFALSRQEFLANLGYTVLLTIVVYSPVFLISFLMGIVIGITTELYGMGMIYLQFLTIPLYVATVVLSTIFFFVAFAVRYCNLWEKMTSEELRKEIDGLVFHYEKADEELEKRLF